MSDPSSIESMISALMSSQQALFSEMQSLGAKFDALAERVPPMQALQDTANGLVKLGEQVADVRATMMARIDRLQDALTKRSDDLSVLLGMSNVNRTTTDKALGEARPAFDQTSELSRVIHVIERQIRQMRDEIDELKDRPAA